MKARFNKIKSRYTNRFSFDNNTTLGIGNVQPLFCKQIAGGSKVSVNFGQLTRLSPLVVPTFARLKQRNDFCFVPMSMIMPSFDAFLSQSAIMGTSKTYTPNSVPCITNQALAVGLFSDPVLSKCTYCSNDKYGTESPFTAFSNIEFFGAKEVKVDNFLSVSTTVDKLPWSYFDFVFNSHDLIASNK